MQKSLFETVFD